MSCLRIRGRFIAFMHSVVAHDMRYTQAIIVKHTASARNLRAAMRLQLAPLRDRFFVAPEGERKDAAFAAQTLKPLDRDEAIDLIQQRAQFASDAEIRVTIGGLDLENHGDHFEHSFRNVRSSRRMKRSRLANS